jgi:Uma2 family endonuclease
MAVESPPVEQSKITPLRMQMSYEDYLTWAGEHQRLTEWVEGEVIVHMPASELHQAVKIFLATLLNLFVNLSRLGRVLDAPFEMRLERSAREPDILFVAEANLTQLTDKRLMGPADLVVEIVSDDSVGRDRDDKFYEYEAARIPEYWIIDPRPNRRRAYFYQLDPQGQYQQIAVGAEGVYRSQQLPGFWLKPAWLWQETLPDPLATFAEIAGPEKVIQAIQTKS